MKQNLEAEWPFPERRNPRLNDPDYLGSKALSRAVQQVVMSELCGKRGLNILDVGCGKKPFYPYFAGVAQNYLGTDIVPCDGYADRVCPAEKLDIENEWADVVICLSVLEHVDDPIQVVRELARVAKPDGIVFASTHGCFPWHPYPQDHWRWTQTGLPLLFRKYGGFSSVDISATRGTVSGWFFLMAHYAYGWSRAKRFGRLLIILINLIGEFLDSRTPSLHNINRPITAIPEFFVIARKSIQGV
jgi:SAM-dependent methyltransferase